MNAPKWDDVRAVLESEPSTERRLAQRARLIARTDRPATARLFFALATSVTVGLGVGLLLFKPAALGVDETGAALTPGLVVEHAANWRLSEKSQVTVADASKVSLLALDRTHVELELELGRVDLAVTHGTGRTWLVHAGDYVVRVVGTKLRVSRTPQLVEVEVTEGIVEVRGPGGSSRQVRAPEVWRNVVSPSPEPEITEDPVVVQALKPNEAAHKLEPAATPTVVSWRTFFEQGAYAQAMAAAQTQGILNNAEEANVADVMSLATAARLTGQSTEAARLLRLGIAKSGPHQAEAAFLLGRLELQRGRQREAAEAFEKSVSLAPTGPVGDEAWGRLLETVSELHEVDWLHRTAEQYLSHFPQGASAERAKKALRP